MIVGLLFEALLYARKYKFKFNAFSVSLNYVYKFSFLV